MNSVNTPAGDPGSDPSQTQVTDPAKETMNLPADTSATSTPIQQADPASWVGRQLGKYKITGVLGVGGMGVVLQGHDSTIERDVAIKLLPSELSADSIALNRFLVEAKSAGQLNHPNAITIYDIGQEGSTHYQVMEIVSGGSVEEHLEKHGAYSVADATRMISAACLGLSAAHAAGLIHRDIKPSNLLLTQDGSVKISDFGLAKRTQSQSLQMTRAGQIIGTPYYMSPEQCQSQEVDVRSDVYSLGATYYNLLTGETPYSDGDSLIQVMYAHCNSPPPNPREIRFEVPTACVHIIERAMAKQPDDRYASTAEMRRDLEAVLAALSGTDIELPSHPSDTLATTPVPESESRTNSSASRQLPILVAAFSIVLVAVVGVLFLKFGQGNSTRISEFQDTAENGAANLIPPPAGEPIRIGILHSLTGTMSDSESPVVDAVLLAINELNSEGGLLGRPVEAVIADGRSHSDSFAREAERLIKEEQVATVFGCWTSASRKTVVPIFEKYNHLLVYPVQYEGIEESPNVIYLGATPNQQIIPAVKWAYAFQDKRRFFIVGSDYVFPRVASEIIKDQLNELNAELVGELFVPLGSVDVKTIIQKIQDTQPDIILNLINGDTNTIFFRELHKQGITPSEIPTISFSIGEAELQRLDTSRVAGDYAASNYFQSVESPENQRFVSRFKERYGPQRVLTDAMEAAYFGVKLWGQAVQDASSIEPLEIRDAMRNQTMQSPGGNVRIDPKTQHTFKTPRIGRIQADGQFEIIWIAAKPESPIPYPASRTTEKWTTLIESLYTDWGGQWAAQPDD